MIFCDGSDEIFTDEEREELEAAEAAREEEAEIEMLRSWPRWAAALWLEVEEWIVTVPGWREMLKASAYRGPEDRVTWRTLKGPPWARRVLAETAEAGA